MWENIPPITRVIFLSSFTLSALVTLEVVSPLKLYFNWKLVTTKNEWWRLFTCILFTGSLSPHTIFNFYLCFRYSYGLENTAFRSKPADFLMFILAGSVIFLVNAHYWGLQNLSGSMSTMMLYLWARKNPNMMMSFLDIIHFRSCFLPIFMLLMIVLSGYDPTLDLIGSVAGHVYYFFDEVIPRLPETKGLRLMRAPRFLVRLCELL
jgi:Derlin-2/3